MEADLDSTRVGQKAINVEANQLPPSCNKSQKVIEAETIPSEVIPPTSRGRKVVDAESRESAMNTSRGRKVVDAESRTTDAMNTSRGQKVVDTESRAEIAMKKSRTGRIIKPSAKAKDAIRTSGEQQNSEIENLIVQLTSLLEAWDEDDEDISVNLTQTEEQEPGHGDPLKILAIRINLANATDQDQFVCSAQFDVEERETYARAMQGPNSTEWAKAMEEELDQLRRNETWDLVHRNNVEPGHRPLGGK